MKTYTVQAVDYAHEGREWGRFSRCEIIGLKYPVDFLKTFAVDPSLNVSIHPGLHHGLGDEVDAWEAILSELYGILQLDLGANLQNGDEFVVDGTGWKFKVEEIHVVPVGVPEQIRLESNRRSAARRQAQREAAGW
jgi:hypothetical protein